jgi:hypothetical protein
MQRSIVASSDPKYWSSAGKQEVMQDEPDGRLLVQDEKSKNLSRPDDPPMRGHAKISLPLWNSSVSK